MNIKVWIITIAFIFKFSFASGMSANDSISSSEIQELYYDISTQDSILNGINLLHKNDSTINNDAFSDTLNVNYPTINSYSDTLVVFDINKRIQEIEIEPLDTLLLQNNPLLIDLVFKTIPLICNWENKPDFSYFYFGTNCIGLNYYPTLPLALKTSDNIVKDIRYKALNNILLNAPQLFAFRYDDLPDPEAIKNNYINGKKIDKVYFAEEGKIKNVSDKKIILQKIKINPWNTKANSMLQFSQNSVTSNWYQGGSSNIAILGILTGQLNYDNKKNIQWDNNAEWRAGFNSVEGDTLRVLNTNDDIFKINSKLGIKAGGNWFYSGSVDFSTQLFHNYKSVNSNIMKASFLTPVRLNIGIGLDYKYKKLFSLMLSPVSYKYIYAKDIINVSPKLFGIKQGENVLSQIGSSFKAQFSYSPMQAVQIDSKLSFYTNYEKVEIDWEIVGNFTVNRFFSTRLSLNPRYDNTVILAAGEKAKIQFKELLSFGFAYNLIN